MPKLLGMEPETQHKLRPFLLIGGGAVVLFFIFKGRGAQPIAAEAPTAGTPSMGVVSPAAQPELSQTGQTVSALQQQLQQHQLEYDTAASNLALQQQSQQMRFEASQQTYQLQRQSQLDAQADAITHEQFKQLKAKGKTGGFFGSLLDFAGRAVGIYGQAEGLGIAPVPYPQNRASQPVQIAKPRPFNPGVLGGPF